MKSSSFPKTLGSILAILSLLVLVMGNIAIIPDARGGSTDTENGITPLQAGTINITVDNVPYWDTDKSLDNDNAETVFAVIVEDTTTVQTDIMFKGSENMDKSSGTYDYIGIENIWVAENQTGAGAPSGDGFKLENASWDHTQIEPVDGVSGTAPWMNDVPIPENDNIIYSYFFLTTRSNQYAGDYSGTLYVTAVEA